jgi:hypothetical protein
MYARNADVAGWSEYPTMEGLGEVEAPAPTSGYATSGDPRQLAVNNPAQIRVDAANFRLLDYPAPDTGNAYDPLFVMVVRSFQESENLHVDGLIGPITRQRLVLRVTELPGVQPVPAAPIPTAPGGGGLTPASGTTSAPMSTGKKVAIGAGVVAAAAGLYYALR